MENLKTQIFTATDWANPSIIVKGKLVTRDFHRFEIPEKGINANGYLLCIENEPDGITVVDPESIQLVLKPHPDFDFENEDKVFVFNSDGTVSYFLLIYSSDTFDWCLVPYSDKAFTTPLETNGKVMAEPLIAFGIDVLERLDDFDIDTMD